MADRQFNLRINGKPHRINNLDGQGIDSSVERFGENQLKHLSGLSRPLGLSYTKVFYVEYTTSEGAGAAYTVTVKSDRSGDTSKGKVMIVKESTCTSGELEFLFTTDPEKLKTWPKEHTNTVGFSTALASSPEIEFVTEGSMPLSISGDYETVVLGTAMKDTLEIPKGLSVRALGDRSGCIIWSIGTSAKGYGALHSPILDGDVGREKVDEAVDKLLAEQADPAVILKSFASPGAEILYKQYSHAYDFTTFWNLSIAVSCPWDSAPSCGALEVKIVPYSCAWNQEWHFSGGGHTESLASCEAPCGGGEKAWRFYQWQATGAEGCTVCEGAPCVDCPGEGCNPGPGPCEGLLCVDCPGGGCNPGSCTGIPCLECPGNNCEGSCMGVPCEDCPGDDCEGPGCEGTPCVDCPGTGCTGNRCQDLPCNQCNGEGCAPVSCVGAPCVDCPGEGCNPGACAGLTVNGPMGLQGGGSATYSVTCGGGGECASPQWSLSGGGSLVGSTVTAPAINPNCANNGVLTVTCSGGVTGAVGISYNIVTGFVIAGGTSKICDICYGSCHDVYPNPCLPNGHLDWRHFGYFGSSCASISGTSIAYDCAGNTLSGDRYIPVSANNCQTAPSPSCYEHCCSTSYGTTRVSGSCSYDSRTPAQITAGCCPDQLY